MTQMWIVIDFPLRSYIYFHQIIICSVVIEYEALYLGLK